MEFVNPGVTIEDFSAEQRLYLFMRRPYDIFSSWLGLPARESSGLAQSCPHFPRLLFQ
jgi:hypothetical protein